MNIYVYISGPLSNGDKEANIKQALAAAEKVFLYGGIPFVPHLFEFYHREYPHSYDFWLNLCLVWLKRCDLLWRLPGESNGADTEVECALSQGKLVMYSENQLQRQFEQWYLMINS